MTLTRRDLLAGIALCPAVLRAAQGSADFRSLAPTPPMGWNSWDSFATTIREEDVRAVAQIMARQLLPHGYDIFTIDADMLPLGALELGRRKTRFTPDEQMTLMTLWSIARSPLIMGGDLRKLDDSTLALLTNDEVLAVNQAGREQREIFRTNGLAAWRAKPARGSDVYVALFNLRDALPAAPAGAASAGTVAVPIRLTDVGITGSARVRDLWRRADLGIVQGTFAPQIPSHGAGLFRLFSA